MGGDDGGGWGFEEMMGGFEDKLHDFVNNLTFGRIKYLIGIGNWGKCNIFVLVFGLLRVAIQKVRRRFCVFGSWAASLKPSTVQQ